MSTYRKLMTFGCAAVLALGLAACGGGGDDDTADAPTVTEPTGPTQEELDAAQAAAEEAAREAAEAEQALRDKEAADELAAKTRDGRALHFRLGRTPLGNLVALEADTTSTPNRPAVPSLTSDGLMLGLVDHPTDATMDVRTARMKPTDAVDALNGWAGQMYRHPAGATVDEALVYSYRSEATGKPAPEVFGATDFVTDTTEVTGYNPATRTLTFSATPADATSKKFKADMFPAAGTTTYRADPGTGSVSFMGYYDGAPGSYRCIAATCSAQMTDDGIQLTGTWTFVHDAGASTSVADSSYQYFGWWLRKVTGVPNNAGAFFGTVGAGNALVGVQALSGSATYSGSAAGKFAIDEPLNGTGDAGHFTADVSLNAKFGTESDPGVEAGISGSLTNFMANDEAVDWTVTLRHARWGADGDQSATDATSGTFSRGSATAPGGTIWSIDGNAADPAGSWNGRVYDDAAADRSTVPTVAVGVFHSNHGSTHTMVGGFGARKD